jgi:histidinol-phosphate aminotransferase
MAAALNTMRGIGNVNAMAQAGAVAALSDPSHVDKVRRETDQARNKFIKDLSRFGVTMVPGAANFVLVKFPATQTNRKAVDAFRHLVSEGIIVRTNEDYGLDDYLRITIGTIEECDQVIESLDRFFN